MTREDKLAVLQKHRDEIAKDPRMSNVLLLMSLEWAVSTLENNVGMSMSHRAIAKVINDYIANHRGDSDKQYTAHEIKTLLISDDSDSKGEWIYDKDIHNWRCSRCSQTPPPTGYVGNADFMAKHFKFCPDCGADMRGE